jgi:hypothetical protein
VLLLRGMLTRRMSLLVMNCAIVLLYYERDEQKHPESHKLHLPPVLDAHERARYRWTCCAAVFDTGNDLIVQPDLLLTRI